MPRSLKGRVYVVLSLLLAGALIYPWGARANPDLLYDVIIRADSLDRADGDDALGAYVGEQSILIGAVVALLIEDAIFVGDDGDAAAEKENLDFAEKVVRHHLEQSGSDIPKQLLKTSRGWGANERSIRREARAVEEQAVQLRNTREPEALNSAIELYTKARGMYEQIDDRHSIAVNWGSLGVAYWYLGDMDGARTQYEQALVARRLVEDRILEGKTLNSLGSVNLNLGNAEVAEDFYKQAIELRTKTRDDLPTTMTYLGQLYYLAGDQIAARDQYDRALAVSEKRGDVGGAMRALSGLASIYYEMGRLNASNDAYRRGIEILSQLDEPSDEIALRSNLATNLMDMGRYGEALDQLTICEQILKEHPDPMRQASVHSDRAQLYATIGELDRARDEVLAYLKLARELDVPRFEVEALSQLGSLYYSLGAYDRALASAEKAIEMGEAENLVANVRVASIVAGDAALLMNDPDKAMTFYKKALAIDEKSESGGMVLADNYGIASALAWKGDVEEARKHFRTIIPEAEVAGFTSLQISGLTAMGHTFEADNPDSAEFYYEAALAIVDQSREDLGGAATRTGFLSGERRRMYEEVARYYATLAHTDLRWSEKAFWTMERAKARGLLDLMEQSVSAESSPEEEAILDKLYSLAAEKPDATKEIQELEEHYLKVRDDRVRGSIGSLESKNTIASMDDVRKTLAKGTVMLSYALGDTSSLLWVIDRDGHSVHTIADRHALGKDVLRLRDAIGRPGAGDEVLRKTARSLYQSLIEPVEGNIAGRKKLIVVPDGVLFEVPFEILMTEDPNGGGWENQPFLARTAAPLYAPSASVFVELTRSEDRGKHQLELLALGDPDFSLFESEETLGALPYTRAEVLAISANVKDDRKKVLLGNEANEAELKDKLRSGSPRVLHLATHGIVDPFEPASSNVVLCPDAQGREDGYLYTLEILALPMDVGLVVVSACESARGQVSRSEGVVGLSRAFIASGAEGLVASLWAVSDESSAELMKEFYNSMLDDKRTAAMALNDARLALIQHPDYAHPFYWSPFIMIGTEKSPW